MLQINPETKLPIIRQLNNPSDNTGYYVRAVVRNSLTDVVLKTINLADAGGGRFEGTYLVPPADGTYFDITTMVYSDAGYTTQDTMYADETNQYLGAIRWGLQYWNAGNGGGADIDYKKIRKIVEEEVGKITTLSQEEVSGIVSKATNEIQKAIESTHKAVSDIVIPEVVIPEQKEVDLSPVQNKLQEVTMLIGELKAETESKSDNILATIGGVAEQQDARITEVSGKQDEFRELLETRHAEEMGMALGERNDYKAKLEQIQGLVGSTMNKIPDQKKEDDRMAKEAEAEAQKAQELRVKNYIK
jgi:uncharacterized protein YjbJ (UPF0337 family)